MNRIEPVDLGPNFFLMSYRTVTEDTDWLAFHAHRGVEFLYVHEGSGTVTVEGRQFPLCKGSLFFFQPYQLHKVNVPIGGAEAPYIRTVVKFEPRLAELLLAPFPQLARWFTKLWRGLPQQQNFQLGDSDRLPQLLEDLHVICSNPHIDKHEENQLFLITFLHELRHQVFPAQWQSDGPESEQQSLHIDRMMDWVEEHFSQTFDLQSMADELHLSSYHLSHLFKAHTGSSISAYITNRRIREACMLLSATSDSIQSIARQVGGFSASHFSQLFKKHKQMSPEAFRKAVLRTYMS
ncbi:MAG: AraC family transcriptional regulator [Gorillibacterium sp.]|nr:AraC family transcriptional regulator [Gorillibacterium sp.]